MMPSQQPIDFSASFRELDEGFCIFELIYDANGNATDWVYLEANPAFERQTGYSDPIGKKISFFQPDLEPSWFIQFAGVARTGKAIHFTQYTAAMGIWYDVYAMPVDPAGGKRVSLLFTDVSERKKTEDALRESEERIQLAVNGANIFTWDVDPETGETTYSDNFNEVIGFEISHISTENFINIYPADEERVLKAIEEALGGKTPLDVEHRVINPQTKEVIWIRAQGRLVQKADGRSSFIGITQNINERKLAEEVLKNYNSRLQQQEIFRVTLQTQEEERRRIAESLHNGLGQILYGVKISLAKLTERAAKNKPEKYEADRHYANDLLSEAIRDTRRISHELMPAVLDEFGLQAAIKEIFEQMQGSVRFRYSIDTDDVHLDKYMELAVFRTVQELMMNVVKHAEATEASVFMKLRKDSVFLQVKDNGHGMKEDKEGNDGIGLASIHSKAGLLNGELKIDADPGKGTEITVSWPIPGNK